MDLNLPEINVTAISDWIDQFVAFIKEATETMKKFIAGFKSNYVNLTTEA